jgi:hypothetical protein
LGGDPSPYPHQFITSSKLLIERSLILGTIHMLEKIVYGRLGNGARGGPNPNRFSSCKLQYFLTEVNLFHFSDSFLASVVLEPLVVGGRNFTMAANTNANAADTRVNGTFLDPHTFLSLLRPFLGSCYQEKCIHRLSTKQWCDPKVDHFQPENVPSIPSTSI